ncbi:hypothetical protein HUG20_14480 [Salicibibacter cibi]|uniref:Uncharacterized protein n=1 Tax=Salicibibacter cibi TaxID=2743001 RepID=A0A7T6ZCY9_9BACI|nr:hypothetical protein [Salicibibacter cibi]QQK80980.1 hypothetical protein HUG20_14480 [Salicibibacter cibi]
MPTESVVFFPQRLHLSTIDFGENILIKNTDAHLYGHPYFFIPVINARGSRGQIAETRDRKRRFSGSPISGF